MTRLILDDATAGMRKVTQSKARSITLKPCLANLRKANQPLQETCPRSCPGS
ncbi:hypothetical protein [Paracoccus acridae]|uniref:hypothetical protein n=1 Tax=Paracoccus acridae TaxID=1795310 RepID=UPI001E3F1D2D|nr:hypothetical protein [Paracoccus acridae]